MVRTVGSISPLKNIVCALLLLFLPEEQAFFLLCVICEQLIPGTVSTLDDHKGYWAKAMIGSIVDQRIFEGIKFLRD